MNQEPLPQIYLIRDTDLTIFAYELHIFAGNFLRESEFNLRSLVTNTGRIRCHYGKKPHVALRRLVCLLLYGRPAPDDLYNGISWGKGFFVPYRAERKRHLYGDVLMMDLDTLRQDVKRNILYPYGVNTEQQNGKAMTVSLEKWHSMELYEKDALKSWGFSYSPEQVTEWQYHYSGMFSQWKEQAFSYMPQDLEERLNVEYMTGAQNPDTDMYRIPLGTAKQMLLYDEAPVYRLLPGRPGKDTPYRGSYYGAMVEHYREFAVRPEDLGALDRLAQWETDRIIGKPPALHKPEKGRSDQER